MPAIPAALKSIAAKATAVVGIRPGEEPAYKVLDRFGPVEVRQYGPRVAAKVEIEAAAAHGGREAALAILARYGQGANRAKPASAYGEAGKTGTEAIALSGPMLTSGDGERLVLRAVLPRSYSRDTAPEPTDRRVRIIALPEETVAVLRFAGRWTEAALAARQQALAEALRPSAWRSAGEPFLMFYDRPWTLPFLRRNEAAVPVAPAADVIGADAPLPP